jgi:hypothetical protein
MGDFTLEIINKYLKLFRIEWIKVKKNVKFSLEQTLKVQRGSRGIALLFL